MSTTSTPDESPMHIQPLHNPSQAAVPLGNNNGQMGLGTRALLSKRLAKEQNPKFVSPTDKMVTPVSQKLNAARKKHFDKGKPKPMSLFASNEPSTQEDDGVSDDGEAVPAQDPPATDSASDTKMVVDDDENPF